MDIGKDYFDNYVGSFVDQSLEYGHISIDKASYMFDLVANSEILIRELDNFSKLLVVYGIYGTIQLLTWSYTSYPSRKNLEKKIKE